MDEEFGWTEEAGHCLEKESNFKYKTLKKKKIKYKQHPQIMGCAKRRVSVQSVHNINKYNLDCRKVYFFTNVEVNFYLYKKNLFI